MRFFLAICLLAVFCGIQIQIFSGYLIIYAQRFLYENQISTQDEVARNDFRLAGNPFIFDHLNEKYVVRKRVKSSYFFITSCKIHTKLFK